MADRGSYLRQYVGIGRRMEPVMGDPQRRMRAICAQNTYDCGSAVAGKKRSYGAQGCQECQPEFWPGVG